MSPEGNFQEARLPAAHTPFFEMSYEMKFLSIRANTFTLALTSFPLSSMSGILSHQVSLLPSASFRIFLYMGLFLLSFLKSCFLDLQPV